MGKKRVKIREFCRYVPFLQEDEGYRTTSYAPESWSQLCRVCNNVSTNANKTLEMFCYEASKRILSAHDHRFNFIRVDQREIGRDFFENSSDLSALFSERWPFRDDTYFCLVKEASSVTTNYFFEEKQALESRQNEWKIRRGWKSVGTLMGISDAANDVRDAYEIAAMWFNLQEYKIRHVVNGSAVPSYDDQLNLAIAAREKMLNDLAACQYEGVGPLGKFDIEMLAVPKWLLKKKFQMNTTLKDAIDDAQKRRRKAQQQLEENDWNQNRKKTAPMIEKMRSRRSSKEDVDVSKLTLVVFGNKRDELVLQTPALATSIATQMANHDAYTQTRMLAIKAIQSTIKKLLGFENKTEDLKASNKHKKNNKKKKRKIELWRSLLLLEYRQQRKSIEDFVTRWEMCDWWCSLHPAFSDSFLPIDHDYGDDLIPVDEVKEHERRKQATHEYILGHLSERWASLELDDVIAQLTQLEQQYMHELAPAATQLGVVVPSAVDPLLPPRLSPIKNRRPSPLPFARRKRSPSPPPTRSKGGRHTSASLYSPMKMFDDKKRPKTTEPEFPTGIAVGTSDTEDDYDDEEEHTNDSFDARPGTAVRFSRLGSSFGLNNTLASVDESSFFNNNNNNNNSNNNTIDNNDFDGGNAGSATIPKKRNKGKDTGRKPLSLASSPALDAINARLASLLSAPSSSLASSSNKNGHHPPMPSYISSLLESGGPPLLTSSSPTPSVSSMSSRQIPRQVKSKKSEWPNEDVPLQYAPPWDVKRHTVSASAWRRGGDNEINLSDLQMTGIVPKMMPFEASKSLQMQRGKQRNKRGVHIKLQSLSKSEELRRYEPNTDNLNDMPKMTSNEKKAAFMEEKVASRAMRAGKVPMFQPKLVLEGIAAIKQEEDGVVPNEDEGNKQVMDSDAAALYEQLYSPPSLRVVFSRI